MDPGRHRGAVTPVRAQRCFLDVDALTALSAAQPSLQAALFSLVAAWRRCGCGWAPRRWGPARPRWDRTAANAQASDPTSCGLARVRGRPRALDWPGGGVDYSASHSGWALNSTPTVFKKNSKKLVKEQAPAQRFFHACRGTMGGRHPRGPAEAKEQLWSSLLAASVKHTPSGLGLK